MPFSATRGGEVAPAVGGDPDPEAPDGVLADSAFLQVAPRRPPKPALQASRPVPRGRIARGEHLVALLAAAARLGAVLLRRLRDLDAHLLRERLHHLGELLAFEPLQEREHVTVCAAAIALEVLVLGVDVEARRALPVEDAAALPRSPDS